ncbi:hypothetical protein LEP1GSC016_2453 [Leptospira borgpetersenii serovar Hardjo-bovis str. Sponselee]|uniref:Uncharacterized protein n=1 Tax=Leptospira borgpetersenii serovar Hardjo-bovis str. Sponselee TaxID=1303729 RepID=M6BBT0_LEPBO|nr:hypothetical protein LEP1GSC016_2453 [Leptospira borgpetersenii serovar Hardjo-bovis str. Sponselee]
MGVQYRSEDFLSEVDTYVLHKDSTEYDIFDSMGSRRPVKETKASRSLRIAR